MFSQLHGTYRKVDRIYNAILFSGKGKSIYELTESELKEEMAKRQTESKAGYENDYNPYIEELEKLMLASNPP